MPWTRIKVVDPPSALEGVGDRIITYPEAIREALDQALDNDPRVFVMGQGVDDPGGMFGCTKGLHQKHGHDRVFDTPLAESGLTGMAVGAALGGVRPVYFHNRPDFLLLAMDAIVNHASKWHYMFGGAQSVPLVIWACIGRGWGSAAQHSQALQGLFMHVPGLKLVMPATAHDAKGLLLEAIADPNPVVVLEHRHNFKIRCGVPEGLYRIPFGQAALRREGKDITIAAVSFMVLEACCAAEGLANEGIDAEVIDLRTLRPLDEDLLLKSLAKTGRLVVADMAWKTCGAAAEIAAVAAEKGFGWLKAPVRRVTCPDTPTPAGYTLENGFYPGADDIMDACRELVKVGK